MALCPPNTPKKDTDEVKLCLEHFLILDKTRGGFPCVLKDQLNDFIFFGVEASLYYLILSLPVNLCNFKGFLFSSSKI